MTITIEVAPETEARLQEKARRAGVGLDTFLRSIVEREADVETPAETKRKRVLSGYGIAAHLNVSSEDVHRDRRAEVERDERLYQERQAGRGERSRS